MVKQIRKWIQIGSMYCAPILYSIGGNTKINNIVNLDGFFLGMYFSSLIIYFKPVTNDSKNK